MLCKELILVCTENHDKTHQYKIQSFWLLKQLAHVATIRFKGLIHEQCNT
jgi:hypothetical protein